MSGTTVKIAVVTSQFATYVDATLRLWMCLHPSNGCRNCPEPCTDSGWVCFGPEPLYTVESIERQLDIEVDDLKFCAYFWEQSDIPSTCNAYWTEATTYGGGLKIDNAVFGGSWNNYRGAHSWFNYKPEELCWCKVHDCTGSHSKKRHAAAAAATPKPAPIPLIVVEPPTLSVSEIYCNN